MIVWAGAAGKFRAASQAEHPLAGCQRHDFGQRQVVDLARAFRSHPNTLRREFDADGLARCLAGGPEPPEDAALAFHGSGAGLASRGS